MYSPFGRSEKSFRSSRTERRRVLLRAANRVAAVSRRWPYSCKSCAKRNQSRGSATDRPSGSSGRVRRPPVQSARVGIPASGDRRCPNWARGGPKPTRPRRDKDIPPIRCGSARSPLSEPSRQCLRQHRSWCQCFLRDSVRRGAENQTSMRKGTLPASCSLRRPPGSRRPAPMGDCGVGRRTGYSGKLRAVGKATGRRDPPTRGADQRPRRRSALSEGHLRNRSAAWFRKASDLRTSDFGHQSTVRGAGVCLMGTAEFRPGSGCRSRNMFKYSDFRSASLFDGCLMETRPRPARRARAAYRSARTAR